MRILCFGKDGLLSSELQKWLPELNPMALHFLSKNECDITDSDAVSSAFKDIRPTHVINAAAYTKVDQCEEESALANAINGYALQSIVQQCKAYNATLVHFSTDYVFNGNKEGPYDETDPPLPLNKYGESKLLGEEFIRHDLVEHYILRVQWVFGLAKKNFISNIIEHAQTKPELKIINDQFGTPTSTTSISKAVVNLLLNAPEYGTYHFRSLSQTTWYDYAKFFLSELNIRTPIIPVTSKAYKTSARRPQNGVLNIAKWIYADLYTPPSWKVDVKNYLEKIKLISEEKNAIR